MKYFTKTYLYHLVTRTEYGFSFEKVIYSIGKHFLFFVGGLKGGFCSKTQPYYGLIEEIPYKNISLSPHTRDRGCYDL